MSAESEFTRDKQGYLQCKDCPRRFITETGLENHSFNQHKKESKPDESQQSENKKDESSFSKIIQSEGECSLENLFFGRKNSLKIHINTTQKKLTPYKCQECMKYFGLKQGLQRHMDVVHKKLKPYECKECKTAYSRKNSLQIHVNTTHKKLTPHLP